MDERGQWERQGESGCFCPVKMPDRYGGTREPIDVITVSADDEKWSDTPWSFYYTTKAIFLQVKKTI